MKHVLALNCIAFWKFWRFGTQKEIIGCNKKKTLKMGNVLFFQQKFSLHMSLRQ